MFFLRRHICVSFIFAATIVGIISFGIGFYLFTYSTLPFWQIIAIEAIIFFGGTILYFIVKINNPLQKIIREQKALLTGKPYRKIYTTKVNEWGVLAHFFNEITRNLESISGDMKTHHRVQKELLNAMEIQDFLIPKKAPDMSGLEVTAKTRPASEIGGDSFCFYNKNNNNFFYIGDSTGHGIPAGIVMVMVAALLDTFLSIEGDLVEAMVKLNQYLKPHLKPTMFMTMALFKWEPESHRLKWVGGGHEYIVVIRNKTGKAELIPVGGLAIGMIPDNRKFVTVTELQLEENDIVILYTDGIIESKNITGEFYGLERLKLFLEEHCSAETRTQTLFEQIAIDVGRFMEGQAQLDDMTLIVLKHTNAQKAGTPESTTEW